MTIDTFMKLLDSLTHVLAATNATLQKVNDHARFAVNVDNDGILFNLHRDFVV
jgi:alpha-galactosidase/6-phospho-beta-glucosidase family protein